MTVASSTLVDLILLVRCVCVCVCVRACVRVPDSWMDYQMLSQWVVPYLAAHCSVAIEWGREFTSLIRDLLAN